MVLLFQAILCYFSIESTRNETARGSRRASAPASANLTSAPTVVTSEEWSRRLNSILLPRSDINALVMNYLIIEGYKEAAEKFARETGVTTPTELGAIESRVQVRNAIQRGSVLEAVDLINELDAGLLDDHPRIYFHLHRLHVVELIRQGRVDEALEHAQEVLAPVAERHVEFLRELERTMAMLVWNQVSVDTTARVRLANEVNQALLTMQCRENESRLPSLLRQLHLMQCRLVNTGKVSCPRIIDFATAKFEPPISTEWAAAESYYKS